MSKDPILILQMQRMGDMVLTFPLLGWLAGMFPGHPLWVLGEPLFFEPLMPLSPEAVYFGPEALPRLEKIRYAKVINLSHRPEAAAFAGRTDADVLGPWQDKDGSLYINGAWQLYRASLTGNNRYNRYHWSDLNALDCIPLSSMRKTLWPRPSVPSASGGGRIGLFLGASQPQKHPDANFWTALTQILLRSGFRPVLLGGKAEARLGMEVAHRLKAPALNLCDRFSVRALAEFVAGLDLFVCPDTGPMHVAAWSGTPTLNLSLGPVNAWETGPSAPGHHVLRAAVPCVGCWSCSQPAQLCREYMRPSGVAAVIRALMQNEAIGPHNKRLSRAARGLEILRTGRDKNGLYRLESLLRADNGEIRDDFPETHVFREALSAFWQTWFGCMPGLYAYEEAEKAKSTLQAAHEESFAALKTATASFAIALAQAAKASSSEGLLDDAFWRQTPPCLHPFSGYIHMYLQNAASSKASLLQALAWAERLASL